MDVSGSKKMGGEEMISFAGGILVKRRDEIPKDLFKDVKFIFHTSFLTTLDDKRTKELSRRPPTMLLQKTLNEPQLELPRRLPRSHDFSGHVLLVFYRSIDCSVMVFLIDYFPKNSNDVSMYHVLSKKFEGMGRSRFSPGYAVIGDRLYFVGGYYPQHHDISARIGLELLHLQLDKEKSKKKKRRDNSDNNSGDDYLSLWQKAKTIAAKHLDVPTYNLRTKAWESGTPCLKAPKPNPVVFVYEGKIFALRGGHRLNLHQDSPPFELLDTTDTPPCWRVLSAPPFDMEDYQCHILDEENGILFLFLKHSSDHPCREQQYSYQLNLKKKTYEWTPNESNDNASKSKLSHDPDPIHPGYSVGLGMTHISETQSHGCIVDNIIFCYQGDYKFEKPVILGQYVGCDESSLEPWVIDGLDEVLAGKFNTCLSFGFLNHIGKYRFCLIIQYFACHSITRANSLYFVIFDLVKKELPDASRKIKRRNACKVQKASNCKFVFKPVSDGAFQVPNCFSLRFCKNL